MIQWIDQSVRAGTITITHHEAKTLIGSLAIHMRSDGFENLLGFTTCVDGRMISSNEKDVDTAKANAIGIFRELLRDQLGSLG